MNSTDIQNKLSELFHNHDHHFRNKYIFDHDWECDFFSVTKAGYMYEVEIKISKSDYQADFIKFKHKLFEGRKQSEVIKEAKYKWSKRWKKQVRMSPEKKFNPAETTMPNRFFFACPEGLIDVNEVPEYAGLIYVDKNTQVARIVKQAPLLHNKKEDIQTLLFPKYRWGYFNAVNDLQVLQKKYDDLCRGIEKKFNLTEGSVNSLSSFNKLIKK
jgi:hypothetical protein